MSSIDHIPTATETKNIQEDNYDEKKIGSVDVASEKGETAWLRGSAADGNVHRALKSRHLQMVRSSPALSCFSAKFFSTFRLDKITNDVNDSLS